ncbi:MAG: PD-(D/E)XK nuclease family protein [Cyanobacteria bacterium J06642_2]
MAYHLSATKLQTYHRCPQAYYFRYERKVPAPGFFGSLALGVALHKALAKIHGDWHYNAPRPEWEWLDRCWQDCTDGLTPKQIADGRDALQLYFKCFICTQDTLHRPLAIESKIQGRLQVQNVEFVLTGRCDRLDWLPDGLKLVDYKSAKSVPATASAELDLQLGLYYLALEQKYGRSLKQLSLIYLRSGRELTYDVTSDHRRAVESAIGDLALRLRTDDCWPAEPGGHCDRCSFARYCNEASDAPDPLPHNSVSSPQLQLVLNL